MKTKFILLLSVFVSMEFFSQVLIDVEPEKNAHCVVPLINPDGTFELRFDNASYLYDSDGIFVKKDPLGYDFSGCGIDLNGGFSNSGYTFVYNSDNSIFYTYDQKQPKSSKIENKDRINIYNDKKKEKESIEFEDKKNEKFKSQICSFSYIDLEGNPVFIISGDDPFSIETASKEKPNHFNYVKRIVYNLKDNSVGVSVHLLNKIPENALKSKYIIITGKVLGYIEGKLYVAYEYQEKGEKLNKVDIWSINDVTNEETLEYSFDYMLEGNVNLSTSSSVKVISDSKTSDIFFQIPYGKKSDDVKSIRSTNSSYANTANYKILCINHKQEFKILDLSIPIEVLSVSYTPPDLTCYQNNQDYNFFLKAGSQNGFYTVLVMTYSEEDSLKLSAFRSTALDRESLIVMFDERTEELAEAIVKPIFMDPKETCKLCPMHKASAFAIDENNIARVVSIEYLMDPNCTNCTIRHMKVRLDIQELPTK